MTNLHGEKAATKTQSNTSPTRLKESNLTHSISMTNGAAGIPTKSTEATHLTINMYDPDDNHDSDYAEENHNSKCEERDIEQGIQTEV